MVPEYNFLFHSFVCVVFPFFFLAFVSRKRRLSGRQFVYIY